MATSKIHVQYRDGSPGSGIPVRLGFNHLFSGGVTDVVYTDRSGTAIIHHSVTGRATIFVNGKDRGTFSSPGEDWITI